ncbi:unnamed protein product, partial [Rotaria magnacalcarata]
MLGGYTLWGQ